MNIILLSGGSGKRLWPLSNDIRSKQFLKIFRTASGSYESMVQRVYRQILQADPEARITIATSRSQLSSINSQLGNEVEVSIEPCRKDTFPAISLSAAYLHDVLKISDQEVVIICPVDPYVEEDYFLALKDLGKLAEEPDVNIALLGIQPTYPSAKYGYIIPEKAEKISKVEKFREKPDAETADKYIKQGALWNGGVFACRLGYLLAKAQEKTAFNTYSDLLSEYDSLEKISFDYAVVEKEPEIKVLRFQGAWKDLGTWNTLTEAMEESVIGKAIVSDTSENVNVINELNVPIICMGLKNMVVAASPDGVLVSDKQQSSYLKPYADQVDQQIMFAEKSWGSFRVLDVQSASMTILVTLNPGNRMNYHSHAHRDESWNIISGEGMVVLDGTSRQVHPGDIVKMPAGCKHTILAKTELKAIEVQIGRDINVDDKQKYDLDIQMEQ